MTPSKWVTPVVAVLVIATLVVAVRSIPRDHGYTAELHHAAGVSAGDPVRVAGLDVGKVTDVSARRDTVYVEFTADPEVALTEDTRTTVKLASLLGQRYLELQPGSGAPLTEGDTIARRHNQAVYTMDRFWLEATYEVRALDTEALEQAIAVLGEDLAGSPEEVRRALTGLTRTARMVTRRDAQLDRVITATRTVTDLVLDQADELDVLLGNADRVARFVTSRREELRRLLRDTRRLMVRLASVAEQNEAELTPALANLETLLTTLRQHESDLDEALRVMGTAMRHFASGQGDGPWLGVNAPWAIFPDDLVCVIREVLC